MASKTIFILLAITLPAIVSEKEFIVGDDMGWTIFFDYQSWALGKDFRVGNKLVFKYPAGAHNVFKVNGTSFQSCTKPPLTEALTTGNDVITLATPGRKWYICGVGKHCDVGGQKLAITVLPAEYSWASTPSPSQSVAANAWAPTSPPAVPKVGKYYHIFKRIKFLF